MDEKNYSKEIDYDEELIYKRKFKCHFDKECDILKDKFKICIENAFEDADVILFFLI
jgi:hypothetical protein